MDKPVWFTADMLTAILKTPRSACSYGFLDKLRGDIVYTPSPFTGCHSLIARAHESPQAYNGYKAYGFVNIICIRQGHLDTVHPEFIKWMLDPTRCAMTNAAARTFHVDAGNGVHVLVTLDTPEIHLHELMSYAKVPRVYTENSLKGAALNYMLDSGIDPTLAVFMSQVTSMGSGGLREHGPGSHGDFLDSYDADFKKFARKTPNLKLNPVSYFGCDRIWNHCSSRTSLSYLTNKCREFDRGFKTPILEYLGRFSRYTKDLARIQNIPQIDTKSMGGRSIESIHKLQQYIKEEMQNDIAA